MTILRGKVVVEGDRWLGDAQGGTWLPRRIPPRSAPAPRCSR